MAETNQPVGDLGAPATRDWIKALVLIAVVLGLLALLFAFVIGGFCGCGTRPPV